MMNFLRRLFSVDQANKTTAVPSVQNASDENIIGAFEPWTLACAVGADNGTIGSRMGFDMWLGISRKNWINDVYARLDHRATLSQIENALRRFVAANRHAPYQAVLREQERVHGLPESVVLGPGESVRVSVPLDGKKHRLTRSSIVR